MKAEVTHYSRFTESELVEGCRRNDPEFQQALFRNYYRKMYGVCLRYSDHRTDAEDVLQEGFIKVFRHLKDFRGKGSLEGWIRRIMVHTAIEHYRRNSRYFMVDIESAAEKVLDGDQLSQLSRSEILGQIQQLPTGYRTVFNLYEIEGYSHQEIADMLCISVGTSKSQLSRAKGLLKRQLLRREAFTANSWHNKASA